MLPTNAKMHLHILMLVAIGFCIASCSPSPAPSTTPSQNLQPPFELRQYTPTSPFFQNAPYPSELTSVQDADLQPLHCSPEYFSWDGTRHEYVDAATGQAYPISDPDIRSFLDSAIRLLPDRTIVSISLCEAFDGLDLVIFRAGPCGGGCAGIPNIAYGQPDGSLTLVAEILPDGDGPYYGCSVLQLTTSSQLYLSCLGEGTAIIRRLDLVEREVSIILRCEQAGGSVDCAP